MPRVCPEQQPQNQGCCPNPNPCQPPPPVCCPKPNPCAQQDPCAPKQPPRCSQDRNSNRFDDSDEEEDYVEEKPKPRKKRPPPPPPFPPPGAAMVAVPVNASAETEEQKSSFCQCDSVAFIILLAYLLALFIAILGFWYYEQDTYWNGIVRRQHPFVNLEGETFFSGKYMYLYEDGEPKLRLAKKYLLRENRWLEIIHLTYIVTFLIIGFFQMASYVTRGKEDHTKIVIIFYSLFGGIGLIVALFPMLSWNEQFGSYMLSAHTLQEASYKIRDNLRSSFVYENGITNFTAQDAWTLATVMKRCSEVSKSGLTFDEEDGFLPLFKRKYRMKDLQHFGFCTHHKFKITNTLATFMFAIICCLIPCVYCFGDSNPQNNKKTDELKTTMTTPPVVAVPIQSPRGSVPPPPLPYESNKDKVRYAQQPRGQRKRSSGGSHRSEKKEELTKFKHYVEGEGSEGDDFI